MKKSDRLFQIIQILRQKRRVITAATLAELMEVSERTIYRDIANLISSGVPIEGEAGVGYMLREGYDLPPLMFNEEEIEALTLGARIVSSWADNQLAGAARSVLQKVEMVLPSELQALVDESVLFVPPVSFEATETMNVLRRSIKEKRKIRFSYIRKDGTGTIRTVRPLCMAFFPPTWLLAGWCELRQEFRNFNINSISELVITDEPFKEEEGRSLGAFLQMVQCESSSTS